MSFIEDSWATWIRMGWLAAATTASACARTISIPLQPRHSPFKPQWQSWGRSRSSARWSSDMSVGPAMATNLRGFRLARVHRFDLVAVVLLDDLAFDVQFQGQLAVFLCEVLWQQREVFDRLPVADARVDLVDSLLDARGELCFVQALAVGGRPVGHDERRDIGPPISHHDRTLDDRIAQQFVLQPVSYTHLTL